MESNTHELCYFKRSTSYSSLLGIIQNIWSRCANPRIQQFIIPVNKSPAPYLAAIIREKRISRPEYLPFGTALVIKRFTIFFVCTDPSLPLLYPFYSLSSTLSATPSNHFLNHPSHSTMTLFPAPYPFTHSPISLALPNRVFYSFPSLFLGLLSPPRPIPTQKICSHCRDPLLFLSST